MSMGEVAVHALKRTTSGEVEKRNDGVINKHSAMLTQDPSRGGVQAYMYALGLSKEVSLCLRKNKFVEKEKKRCS